MKRFRFSLERLLDYRRARAEEARRRFAAVNAEVEQIRREIRHLEERREEIARRLLQMHLTAETRREIQEGRAYMEYLWLRMMNMRSELSHWKERLEEARLAMLEAERDLKAIERLKEREFAEHRKSEERQEQRMLDDTASVNHLRRKKKEERTDA